MEISVGVGVKDWVGNMDKTGELATTGVSEINAGCINSSEVGVAYIPHNEGV
jgi:hypothetical protein